VAQEDEVAKMNAKTFRTLVENDVRNVCSDEDSDALRSPLNVRRWEDELKRIKKSVESQLGAKRDETRNAKLSQSDVDTQYKAFLQWRAGAKRFLGAVEDRVIEANTLSGQGNLMKAIRDHQKWMTEHDFDSSEADVELWSNIN
jgi:hypothetical protein